MKNGNKNVLGAIGNTPLVQLEHLNGNTAVKIFGKLEGNNPGGSIKDRPAYYMIKKAEESGELTPDKIIIEPTSGNTGIGLAMVAAVKGYRLILVMPESFSLERRRVLKAYGAVLELTPREKGMRGAIDRATELAAATPNSWIPQQFENPANVEAHFRITAAEILRDFPDGVDYIITGVGTGGHITGCAEFLKPKFPKLKVFAVEPTLSPVISGGTHSPHPLQGIGAGFIPKNLHKEILTGVIQVSKEEAYEFAIRCAKEEGIFVGVSSGAALAAVAKKIPEIPIGSTILTFCYDTGERYLSVEGLF